MELPDFDLAARQEVPYTDLKELPTLCELPGTGTWSFECWRIFVEYEEIANANHSVGTSNTSALRNSDEAYDHIIEAAKLQQQLATIREEMLSRERTEHTQDNWFYRGFIALLILGAMTL